jgi:hypothetical protein
MRMTTMMTMRMRMRTKTTRWMRTRDIPPDNKQDDEPMTEAEIPVSDEVLDGYVDGDGEEASEGGWNWSGRDEAQEKQLIKEHGNTEVSRKYPYK